MLYWRVQGASRETDKRPTLENWRRYAGDAGGVAAAVAEFQEPGQTIWNIALFLILLGLFVGTFFLQRYLRKNIDNVGEARFDTRNKP